jgi:hypothetical protein
MTTNTASVVDACYNLPDLKQAKDIIIALEIFQIVEEVKAHLSVTKQEMISELCCFRCLTPHFRILFHTTFYII